MKDQLSADYPRRQPELGQEQSHEEQKVREGEKELLRLQAEERRRQFTLLFTDKTIRNAFIRKVYSILTIELVIVGIIVVCIHSNKSLKMFFSHTLVFWGIVILFVAMSCIFYCCMPLLRMVPINFILLSIYSTLLGILTFWFTVGYSLDTILIALGITTAVCFFLTLFAFQTAIDFTSYWLYVLVISMVVSLACLVLFFFIPAKPFEIIASSIGVILFSCYLIIDTQFIIGGKHRYAFSPEDYVIASLTLLGDIVYIFYYVLRLVNAFES